MTITEVAQPGDGEGGAKKLDAKKVPLFKGCLSYFPRALSQVALVSRYGAQKYDWNGWEDVPNGEERYMDALARHVSAISVDGNFDVTDSNLPHLAQVAWNALAVLELKMRSGEIPLTIMDFVPTEPETIEEPSPKLQPGDYTYHGVLGAEVPKGLTDLWNRWFVTPYKAVGRFFMIADKKNYYVCQGPHSGKWWVFWYDETMNEWRYDRDRTGRSPFQALKNFIER